MVTMLKGEKKRNFWSGKLVAMQQWEGVRGIGSQPISWRGTHTKVRKGSLTVHIRWGKFISRQGGKSISVSGLCHLRYLPSPQSVQGSVVHEPSGLESLGGSSRLEQGSTSQLASLGIRPGQGSISGLESSGSSWRVLSGSSIGQDSA